MSDTLTALDATFLELEQLNGGALMSIGATMVFDPPPGGRAPTVQELCADLEPRLGGLPRYSQRLSATRAGGLAWPHWEQDPAFTVRNHVRRVALPGPGSDEQLCDWTAELFSHPLDRTRPLWELVVVEGLAGGRWALAHKVHHCLVDGVGSVGVVGLLLDDRPRAGNGHTPGAGAPGSPAAPGPAARLAHLPQPLSQAAQAGARAAEAAVHAALHPKDALERSRALAELIVRDELVAAPGTSLNRPIGQQRRFALVRAELAQLKAVGARLGGSVNDVLLSACAGGLRRLLLERGEPLPARGLRAMVPVNLRSDAQQLALGNRVSSLFVELPVDEPVTAVRLRKIAAVTRRLKAAGAARGAAAMIDLAALAPPAVLGAVLARTEFSRRLFNLTITNVPGSPQPLYAFGAQLRELYPVVPLAAEHAVGIAIFSYNGGVSIGINADCDSMPDLEVLAYGIEEALEELRDPGRSAEALRTGD